ncbi:MAG TPA: DegV family protein [Candidatus Limnocylindrales bacterium]|nr:DegV family protein [Candidatus Limnocylindrales bacterium]
MAGVVFVTDSASDLDPAVAARDGIRIVPLSVSFGDESFRAGADLSTEEFWQRMTAPNAPFPKTAASSPGEFKAVYDAAFTDGADAIVSIHVSGLLSGSIKSAEIAKGMLPEREIHLVDSQGASMAEGILAYMGLDLARMGVAAGEIARTLNDRASDLRMYVSLETLEYLKKGGRISGAQAAIGGLLSVKPIIAVEAGKVETADKPRTRSKSRERCIELICARPIERIAILHTMAPDVDEFRDAVVRRSGVDPASVMVSIVGPSVGPHLGPGCVGAAVLYKR